MDIEDIGKQLTLRKSQIISCSRRTDVPAFYMNEIITDMERGYTIVPNPRNSKMKSKISLDPRDVVGFVWWSKNYTNWIKMFTNNEQPKYKELLSRYTHMFNFTINSESPLEPNVSPLVQRLKQLKWLAHTFTPTAIKCRFDPIVFYCRNDTPEITENNLTQFELIMKFIGSCGIDEVIFSFCLAYPQVKRNMEQSGFILITLDRQQKRDLTTHLITIAKKYSVKMCCCSESDLEGLPDLHTSMCIDGFRMEQLSGKVIKNKKKDSGQRVKCNCTSSRDVGHYDWACSHSCAYCYANPVLVN
jgi:hypothetical protein